MAVNLHSIVRGAIHSLHPDEALTIYHSRGQKNIKGTVAPVYSPAQAILGQVQSENADTLEPSRELNTTALVRKCYLFSQPTASTAPQGIVRPIARGGDWIQRADGTWWLIVAMLEDFTASGWVCIRIQAQLHFPDNAIIEEPEDNDEPEQEPQPDEPDIPPTDIDDTNHS